MINELDDDYMMNEWTDTLLTKFCTLGFTVYVIHSMGLDKCLMSCVHHYKVIWNSLTALKIYASAVHPSVSPSEPLVTRGFISIVLPFPSGPIIEIIQCVGFSDCVISQLNNSFPFLFHHWVLFHCGFPRWLSGKEFTYQCRRPVFNPWVRKIPLRRK